MTIEQSYIKTQEVPRHYRTEIPNIVFELLESREISPADFTLYSVYRRIAGEEGACWVGTRGLVKKSGLSKSTITKSKKVLSKRFEALNGKSLIEITPCDRKQETSDIITIVDIWPENHVFFKKRLTCTKMRNRGVPKCDTRVYQNEAHKKEPYKKEPYKNPPPPPPQKEVDKSQRSDKSHSSDKRSLRSEEDFSKSVYKNLEGTTLSPREKIRLSTYYTEEEVDKALRLAKSQKIKKTLMHLLINILEHPSKWQEATNSDPKEEMALKYNARLAKLFPSMAKQNEQLIKQGTLLVATGYSTGQSQLSFKAIDFTDDLKHANKYLDEYLND